MVHSEQPASRVAVANAPYISDLTGLGQRLGAEGSCRGRLGEAAPGTGTDPGEGRGGRARRSPRGWLRVPSPRGTTAARRNAEGQADGDARDPVGNAGSAAGASRRPCTRVPEDERERGQSCCSRACGRCACASGWRPRRLLTDASAGRDPLDRRKLSTPGREANGLQRHASCRPLTPREQAARLPPRATGEGNAGA